jgi:maltose O-acetyltransferase
MSSPNIAEGSQSEAAKMLSSLPYDWMDRDLLEKQHRARELLRKYNHTTRKQAKKRSRILKKLLAETGSDIWIEPPFYCDYGSQIKIGDNVYVNFNCTFLDAAPILIGSGTFIAPNVSIYTETHSVIAAERLQRGSDLAYPVKIGTNVWIGGGSIILPGVTVGDNTTIGAGSVVTRAIPANVVAVGNPCRVIRGLL